MIRFSLDELSRENGHHTFEDLSRELAQARLVSNVLPATGPVAGGGDQGRDFETFRTYLAGSLHFSRGFIGLASPDTVVFACTIQREDVKGKIKDDLTSICTQGTVVQTVYFLCTEPVKISVRHDLQAWATKEFEVALEVLDGPAIARLLSEHDTFWIARTYLHLPADLSPAPPPDHPAAPEWYAQLRDDWTQAHRTVGNVAELMQVAEGLRHATDTRNARADLGSWLRLMEGPASSADIADTQRARYEISRATLRGTGNLRPAEHHTRAFFADVLSLTAPSDLLDAAVLLQYLDTAARNGESSIDAEQVSVWRASLRGHIASLMDAAISPSRRAGLLKATAYLGLQIDFDAAAQLAALPEQPAKPHHYSCPDDLLDIEFPAWMPLNDADQAMASLLEVIDLLPQAPLFPVDSLARYFDMLTPALVDHPLYPAVRSGLDEATSRQAGEASTAARCRKRATALYRNGRTLAALRELHEAKVNWWHGDTTRDSVLAMLHISWIYSDLLLPQAAKKYALSAGFAALQADDTRVRDLAPHALFQAADCDYQAGAWLSALSLARVAVLLQGNFAADPWNLDRHQALAETLVQAAVIKAASRLRPEIAEPTSLLIADMGLTGEVNEILSAEHSFGEWDEESFLAHSAQELTGVPFSDIAPERVFSFGCLGQQWHIHCRNDRAVVTAAEEFCATAQIVLAELAADDPVLLGSVIEVQVELADTTESSADRVSPLPDNGCTRWQVTLPAARTDAPGEADLELLGTLVIMLHHSSLLPWDKFAEALDKAGRLGLMNRIAAVTDHRTATAYFADTGEEQTGPPRGAPLGDPAEFPAREATELTAPSTTGPGYSREKALDAIQARYDHCAAVTRHTLPRIMAIPEIRILFRQLAEEGRPEWIILMALANTVMNYRMRKIRRPLTAMPDEQWKARAFLEMHREEQPGDPSPSPAEIIETFPMQLRFVAATVAQFWGLQINQKTPDFDAIAALLKARYKYWEDDIDHASHFMHPLFARPGKQPRLIESSARSAVIAQRNPGHRMPGARWRPASAPKGAAPTATILTCHGRSGRSARGSLVGLPQAAHSLHTDEAIGQGSSSGRINTRRKQLSPDRTAADRPLQSDLDHAQDSDAVSRSQETPRSALPT
jgi:hypothetical protein